MMLSTLSIWMIEFIYNQILEVGIQLIIPVLYDFHSRVSLSEWFEWQSYIWRFRKILKQICDFFVYHQKSDQILIVNDVHIDCLYMQINESDSDSVVDMPSDILIKILSHRNWLQWLFVNANNDWHYQIPIASWEWYCICLLRLLSRLTMIIRFLW